MAKKCHLAREAKREVLIARYADRRAALKKAQVDMNLSEEERFVARIKLNKLPRDSSKSRYTTRCQVTGCAKAVYRKYKLNRISFRLMANQGLLPGVTKASW